MAGSTQVDTLAALVEARNEARATLAEMHGLLKDLRQERAEVKELLSKGATRLVVAACYATLQEQLPAAVKDLTQRLDLRFDRLSAQADRQLHDIQEMVEKMQSIQERYK